MRIVSYRLAGHKYQYKIIRRDYGFILINLNLNSHAHLDNWYACKLCMKFIDNNVEAKKPYLKEAIRRLTTSNENGKNGVHTGERFEDEVEFEKEVVHKYKKKPKKFKYRNNYKKLLTNKR